MTKFLDEFRDQLREGKVEFEPIELLKGFTSDQGKFLSHEGETWDFKLSWPHSYSDEIYAGLQKLVAGFANNCGGIIIFNVDDSSREAIISKVLTNFDKFQSSCRLTIHNCPKLEFFELSHNTVPIPCIVVYPRQCDENPSVVVSRNKSFPRWPIRIGSESSDAQSRDLPALFCRPQVALNEVSYQPVAAFLPARPTAIKEFVNRVAIVDEVFSWLHSDGEPRAFLSGRGGSGKTTIAYEIASNVAAFGASSKHFGTTEKFDLVIFMTAKEIELDTSAEKVVRYRTTDFRDEKELYISILRLGEWLDGGDEKLNIIELKSKVLDLMNNFSVFLIIDDIDTLTTKGDSAGADALFLIAARAKKNIKILYTLRSAASIAADVTIAVPGLAGDQLVEFSKLCAVRFGVECATKSELLDIETQTEGRPLAVESVVALRRSTATYAKALEYFVSNAGDGARSYVFQREWDALPADNRARSLLAALQLLKEPVSAESLQSILMFDEGYIKDAISDAREMFIDVHDTQFGSAYALGEMTRQYISQVAKTLERYENIKARVRNYKRNNHPKIPEIGTLRTKVDSLVYKGWSRKDNSYAIQAVALVQSNLYRAVVVEAPAFKEVVGIAYLALETPNLSVVREALYYAMDVNYRLDINVLRKWYFAESYSGSGGRNCERIHSAVMSSPSYQKSEQIDFDLLEAGRLYQTGRRMWADNPEKSAEYFLEFSFDACQKLRIRGE